MPNRWPKKITRMPTWNRLLARRMFFFARIWLEWAFQVYWPWSKRNRLPTRNTVPAR
ncbi:hypothetical protein D3C86_2055240 [compost metagenome]